MLIFINEPNHFEVMVNQEILGFIGALIFACGGGLAFYSLYQILTISWLNSMGVVFSGFFSFLLIGIGLWLIALSVKK